MATVGHRHRRRSYRHNAVTIPGGNNVANIAVECHQQLYCHRCSVRILINRVLVRQVKWQDNYRSRLALLHNSPDNQLSSVTNAKCHGLVTVFTPSLEYISLVRIVRNDEIALRWRRHAHITPPYRHCHNIITSFQLRFSHWLATGSKWANGPV